MSAINDVFISYRREGGAELASLIRKHLAGLGFRVCLDVVSLRSGHFDEAIRREIASAKDFVLLLTPNALDRCRDPDDWVRREIALALQLGLNVVPVYRPPFEMPPVVDLPEDIRELPRHNALTYDHSRSEVSLDDLVHRLSSRGSLWRARQHQWIGLVLATVSALVILLFWRGVANLDDKSTSIQGDTVVIREATKDIQSKTNSIQQDLEALGKSRGLIATPSSAAEHYHNAMVHVADGNDLLAEESFRRYFTTSDGEYYDPYLRFAKLVLGNYSDATAMQMIRTLPQPASGNRAATLVQLEFDPADDATEQLKVMVTQEPDFLPIYLVLDQRLRGGLLLDDLAKQSLREKFVANGGTDSYKRFLLNPNDDLGDELLKQARVYEGRAKINPMDHLAVEMQIDQDITLLWLQVADGLTPRELILDFAQGTKVAIPLTRGLAVVELPRYEDAAKATKPQFIERTANDRRIFRHIGKLQGVQPGNNSVATISYIDAKGRQYTFPEPVSLLSRDGGSGDSSFSAKVELTGDALFGNPAPILVITPAKWMRTVEVSSGKEGPFVKVPQHGNVPTMNVVRCDKVPTLKHAATIEVWVRGVSDDGEDIKPERIEIDVPSHLRW